MTTYKRYLQLSTNPSWPQITVIALALDAWLQPSKPCFIIPLHCFSQISCVNMEATQDQWSYWPLNMCHTHPDTSYLLHKHLFLDALNQLNSVECTCLLYCQIHGADKRASMSQDVLQVPAVLVFKVFIHVQSGFNATNNHCTVSAFV